MKYIICQNKILFDVEHGFHEINVNTGNTSAYRSCFNTWLEVYRYVAY